MNPDVAPAQPNALVSAVDWLAHTITGGAASIVAVIAVGAFGLMLLTGRISSRRGAQLVLGCFITFGASRISDGILDVLGRGENPPQVQTATAPPPLYPTAPPQASRASSPYDPYAGAALPPRP